MNNESPSGLSGSPRLTECWKSESEKFEIKSVPEQEIHFCMEAQNAQNDYRLKCGSDYTANECIPILGYFKPETIKKEDILDESKIPQDYIGPVKVEAWDLPPDVNQIFVKIEDNKAISKISETHETFNENWNSRNEELNMTKDLDENEDRHTKKTSSTDTADELVELTLTHAKKRAKKNHFDVKTKENILNIYKYEVQEHPTLVLDEVYARVANKAGVCGRSVSRIVREYKNTHAFSEPKTNQNRTKSIDLVDDADAIRRKVHGFYFKNELPTIDKVLRQVNDDNDMPNFKRTTFYGFLKKINFKFQSRGRTRMLLDRDEIVLWRRDYLKKIRTFRNEHRKIYYLDEIWVNNSMTSSRQTFLDGISTGFKNPSGKGKRLIICHIGSEIGFVSEALWIFESKKTGDNHEEMDCQSFENWFSSILPRLENNSVIVLDNAPYHSRKLEKIPNSASKKADIQDWLRSKNIEFSETSLKVQLLAIVRENKNVYNKYIIDEMAKSANKIVLRLPLYHCELNPIKLIWEDIKNYIADDSTPFECAEVENIFNDAVINITPDKWKKCIQHVQEIVEPKMWELDNLIEAQTEPLIRNIGNSSSSEYESD